MEPNIHELEDYNAHKARIELMIPRLVRNKVLIRMEGQDGEEDDPLLLVHPSHVVDE
jgi:hypothetical protein